MFKIGTCVLTCIYTHMVLYMHIQTCIYIHTQCTCINTHICIHMHTYMYTRVYAHVYTDTQQEAHMANLYLHYREARWENCGMTPCPFPHQSPCCRAETEESRPPHPTDLL